MHLMVSPARFECDYAGPIATLGPAGTSSEAAGRHLAAALPQSNGDSPEIVLYGTYEEAAGAVLRKEADRLLVANAYQGIDCFYMNLDLHLERAFAFDTPLYGLAARGIAVADEVHDHDAPCAPVPFAQFLPPGYDVADIAEYYQAAVGALGLLVIAAREHAQWHLPSQPAATWGSLAALTVLCSVLGLGLYARGLQQLSPSTAVNVLNLVPVFGLAISVVAIGDTVTPLQLVGGLAVIIGVTVSTRAERTFPAPDLNPIQSKGSCMYKAAIIVDSAMPPGFAANTIAVLALSLGRRVESIIGPDLKDADGSTHIGITTIPLPILKADAVTLRDLRRRAVNEENSELLVVDFTDCAQRTRAYEDYADQLQAADDAQLTYLGLAFHGPRKLVQQLTGRLALLR